MVKVLTLTGNTTGEPYATYQGSDMAGFVATVEAVGRVAAKLGNNEGLLVAVESPAVTTPIIAQGDNNG